MQESIERTPTGAEGVVSAHFIAFLGISSWLLVMWKIDEKYKLPGHTTCWQTNVFGGIGGVIFITIAIINNT